MHVMRTLVTYVRREYTGHTHRYATRKRLSRPLGPGPVPLIYLSIYACSVRFHAVHTTSPRVLCVHHGERTTRTGERPKLTMPWRLAALLLALLIAPAHALVTRTYFATCVKGMEPVLAAELRNARVGASDVEEGHLGVHFRGPPQVGGRAVLWLRSAIRVMEELSWGEDVHHPEDLYAFARESVDWKELITSERQTISVDAICGAGRALESGRARPGDWECPGCGLNVFASKMACPKCGTGKPDGRGDSRPSDDRFRRDDRRRSRSRS